MKIVARMFIAKAEVFAQEAGQIGVTVTLKACQRADGDNVSWTKWTPSGEFTKTVLNPAAAAFYRDNVGRDCRVTIELEDDPRQYGGEYVSQVNHDQIMAAKAS